MIRDDLEAMGLESESALQRMGYAESILIAWESSEVPSDMAWLLFRCTLDANRRTLVAISALTAIGTSVESAELPMNAVRLALAVYKDPPKTAMKKLVSLHTAILAQASQTGVVKIFEPADEGGECRLLFDERGHPHIIAWQVLRACLNLTAEEEPAYTAELARLGFELVDKGPFARSICDFFRKGMPFESILTTWEVWNSASTEHVGRA